MRFPEAIAVMRAGGGVHAGVLHFMDFKDDPRRAWMGRGPLVTYDGKTWDGIGDVVTVSGGGQQVGVVANNMTLTFAASEDVITDDLVAKAIDSEAQVFGRRYLMAIQFFDENWQPVDQYRVIYAGVMDRMSFRHSAAERILTLNIESPFVRRRTPRLETFSDRDQKSKYPNDKALEFISSLKDKTVLWPKY